jgi:hypothetical protein
VLIDEKYIGPEFMLVRAMNAQRALQQGNLDRAAALVQDVLFDQRKWSYASASNSKRWTESILRLKSYAAILGMYVHAKRYEPGVAELYYQYVTQCCEDPKNPFPAAAELFWSTYRASGNADFACTVFTKHIAQLGLQARVMDDNRFTERLEPTEICPVVAD